MPKNNKYKIILKSKEVEPKLYAILFQRGQHQIMKMTTAYTYEDAVCNIKEWISETLNIPKEEAAHYLPMMHESTKGQAVIDLLAAGEEVVVSETNAIMREIKQIEDKQEALDALEKVKLDLPPYALKYLKDEIEKKPDNYKD